MSHRSFPPSYFNPPRVPIALLCTHPRPTASPKNVLSSSERIVRGGKVLFFPSPDGAVRIVGLSESGEWIAEFACRAVDFSELYVRRMEDHVAKKTGVKIAIVG